MSSKDRILEKLRKARSVGAPKTPTKIDPIKYNNPLNQFKDMVQAVGGQVLVADSEDHKAWIPPDGSYKVSGSFGVAENGAVWVEPGPEEDRSSIFLAEHLTIEMPGSEIVNNMHEAYEKLRGKKISYGTFISGPSKTADIEQSLVIGAQGPKSCTVILCS